MSAKTYLIFSESLNHIIKRWSCLKQIPGINKFNNVTSPRFFPNDKKCKDIIIIKL